MQNVQKKTKGLSISKMSIIGMLSAISVILYYFEFRIPLFPDFLQIDLTDLVALVGTIVYGPIVGVFIQLIKNIFHALLLGKTAGVGEIASFIIGVSFVLPIGIICRKVQGNKGYIIGAIVGSISMVVIASILNYFILIPTYAKVFGMEVESFVSMARQLNKNINSFKDMIILAILPFNAIKATLISVLGFFMYKPFRRIVSKRN